MPITPASEVACPRCGESGTSELIHDPNGRYFCVCGTLHNGTRTAWSEWEERRTEYRKRTHPEEVAANGSR